MFMENELILNPDLQGYKIIIRAATREDIANLKYDVTNLTPDSFYDKWKIYKKHLILSGGSETGINVEKLNVRDLIPFITLTHMGEVKTSYECYCGRDKREVGFAGVIHESATCAFSCAIERLHKPKYCFVYKVKL